jgi:MFS transporter, DHA1 family, tetracycline resistance protein
MKIQKEKLIIMATVFIDVLGMGIIIPVLPFYVESFGVSSFVVTLLFSVFAFFSFVSSPFLGALSDRIGRRPVLILSIASTALGWFVFAGAKAVWILFFGRIIDGAAAGNFPIAQSYLIDIAKDEKERTSNLGIIGAVFGIGFILGPFIGAMLSTISPAFPFWFVGGLATLNVIGAYFFLPETHHIRTSVEKKIQINPFLPLLRAAADKLLRLRFLSFFLYGTAFALMNGIFSLFVKELFGMSASFIGYIFAGMGVILVFNQTVFLKNIWLKYFTEKQLEIWFFPIMAGSFLLMDVKNLTVFILGIILITLAQSTLRVVISSAIAKTGGANRRGEVMGIMSSILSVSMIVGPLIGGALFVRNLHWPFLLSAVLLMVAFWLTRQCCENEKISQPERVEVLGGKGKIVTLLKRKTEELDKIKNNVSPGVGRGIMTQGVEQKRGDKNMFEVEKKFKLNEEEKKRLLEGARFLGEKTFRDSYFDTGEFALSKNDIWLRKRGEQFQLKLPVQSEGKEIADQYQEIEGEEKIREIFAIPKIADFEKDIEKFGYGIFCDCTTTRKKYQKEGFMIDLDQAISNLPGEQDFSYQITEIELMVESQAEILSASEKIQKFAQKNELTPVQNRGKVIEYLSQKRPKHFEALVKAGIVKTDR